MNAPDDGHATLGGMDIKWADASVALSTPYPYRVGDRVTSRQLETGRAYIFEIREGEVLLRNLPRRPSRGWARHVRRQKAARR